MIKFLMVNSRPGMQTNLKYSSNRISTLPLYQLKFPVDFSKWLNFNIFSWHFSRLHFESMTNIALTNSPLQLNTVTNICCDDRAALTSESINWNRISDSNSKWWFIDSFQAINNGWMDGDDNRTWKWQIKSLN